MPLLKIKINDKTVCRAGGEMAPQIGVYVGNSRESKEARISIKGYREVGQHTTEHREWPQYELVQGDEVSVLIESEGEASEPSSCSTFDNRSNMERLDRMIVDLVAKRRLSGEGPGPVLSEEALAESQYFCSFCAKHSSEVETMIAGPNVCICGECVVVCEELVAAKAGDIG